MGIGFALLAMTVSACGSDDEAAAGSADAVKVGYIPGASLAPAFIAEDFGCFEEEGLTVEMTPITNPADAIAFLNSGRLDVYIGSPSAGMFNQVAAGANLKMVASMGSINTPGDEPAASGLFGAKGTAEVADLKGERVATLGAVGSATSYLLGKSLESGGLTLDDVEVVTLGAADAAAALKGEGVAAALLVAPYVQQVVADGVATPLVNARKAYGTETTSAAIFGDRLLENDRETGQKYIRALSCAAEALQGDWRADDKVVSSLAGALKVPEEAISGGGNYVFDPELTVNEGTLEDMQRMFSELDGILAYEETIPADDLVDNDIRAEALG